MKQTCFLLFCFVLLLFSCEKNLDTEEIVPRTETLSIIQRAQSVFINEYQSKRDSIDKALGRYGPKFIKVDWNRAVDKRISLGKAVVAPLVFEGNLYESFGNNKRKSALNESTFLYMYKDKNQNMRIEVVRYIADDAFVPEARKSFLGLVVVEDLAGNFLAGYHFGENKVTPISRISGSAEVAINTTTGVTAIWCTTTTWYSCSTYDGAEHCVVVGVDSYCYDDGVGNFNRDIEPGDYGGGGGLPQPPSPCDLANALAQDQSFVDKMSDLNVKTSESYESAYIAKRSNGTTSYDYIKGGQNGEDFNFSPGMFNGSTGFYHNHENNPANLSIFSLYDLQALYLIISQGGVYREHNYTFGLVTYHGDTYLLVVEDPAKFLQYGSSLLVPGSIDIFASTYNNLITLSNTRMQNEANFRAILNINGGAGVKLLKSATNNFGNWKQVGVDANGNAIYADCN